MPLLSSLVLPDAAAADAAVASLQRIAPPVLSVEALLERDLEALEAQIDLPRGALASFRRAVAHHYAPLNNASTAAQPVGVRTSSSSRVDAFLRGA